MSGEKPSSATSAEISYIVYKILSTKLPGGIDCEDSLDDLLRKGVFQTAYPLHDSTAEWTTKGPLSDRQVTFIFLTFWAIRNTANNCFSCWFDTGQMQVLFTNSNH